MYRPAQKTIKRMSALLLFLMVFSGTPTIAEGASRSKKAGVFSYAAQNMIQSHDTLILAPGATEWFEVGFKNTGTKAWVGTKTQLLQLRSLAKRESYFYDREQWVSPVITAAQVTRVNPGQLVYFKALLHAPEKSGVYTESFDLALGTTPITSSKISLPIRVEERGSITRTTQNTVLAIAKPSASQAVSGKGLSVAKLIQSDTSLVMPTLGRNAFEIGYKNTGDTVWPQSGPDALMLRSLVKKESYFSDPSWQSGNSVKAITGGAPGELVYVNFVLNAPRSPGAYTERLALFSGGKLVSGSEVSIPITVTKAPPRTTLATYVASPAAPIPVQPVNSISALDSPMGTPSALPLSTISSTSAGTPFVPQGIISDIRDAERSIRVGITHSNDPIQITASKDYEVRDTSGAVLGTQISGSVTTIIYNRETKLYAVTMQQGSVTTPHPIRLSGSQTQTAQSGSVRLASTDSTIPVTSTPPLVTPLLVQVIPDQDTVFEILTFSNRPGWSTSLNDNKFRAVLEVRHTPATDRIWIINELMLEQYLKGIAETSNSSPQEYQKALLIAARTYAVYHIQRSTKYFSEHFTVRTTDADQVYRGYNAEIRLPNVARAVNDTRGVIVTHMGELAITPYYSQSDGRTRSWEEVWAGTPKAWLKAVLDPGCAGLKMLGHGVGMSARGALLMALDGKGFEEILKYYYTGVELRRVY